MDNIETLIVNCGLLAGYVILTYMVFEHLDKWNAEKDSVLKAKDELLSASEAKINLLMEKALTVIDNNTVAITNLNGTVGELRKDILRLEKATELKFQS